MAYARHQFMLSEPQEDGQPLVDHLRAVQRRTGEAPELLADAPPLPSGLEPLWLDFLELHGSRGSTGWGPARITYADIHAYQSVLGTMLKPREIVLIRKADNVWMAEFAPKPKEAS